MPPFRRSVVSVVAVLAMGLAACTAPGEQEEPPPDEPSPSGEGSASPDSSPTTLTVLVSGDGNVRDLWNGVIAPGFERANPGVDVQVQFDHLGQEDPENLDKLSASTRGEGEAGFDVVDADFVPAAAHARLLEPIGPKQVPALDAVPDQFVEGGLGRSVPYRARSVLLAYNSNLVTTPPTTLEALRSWAQANPGRFTYDAPWAKGAGLAFVSGVLDAHTPPAAADRLRLGSDRQASASWPQGFAALRGLDEYTYRGGTHPGGTAQVISLLGTGQVAMAPVWSDMFVEANEKGRFPAGMKTVRLKDPSLTSGPAYLGVAASSPRKNLANRLLQYVLTPSVQGQVVTDMSGTPVLPQRALPASVARKYTAVDPASVVEPYAPAPAREVAERWQREVAER